MESFSYKAGSIKFRSSDRIHSAKGSAVTKGTKAQMIIENSSVLYVPFRG